MIKYMNYLGFCQCYSVKNTQVGLFIVDAQLE